MKRWFLPVATAVGGAVYLYATSQLPRVQIGDPLGPRAFPVLVGIGLLISSALLAYEAWKKAPVSVPAQERKRVDFGRYAILLGTVAWTASYYFSFERLGYLLSTTIYLFVLLCWFHRGKYLSNAVIAVASSIVVYYIFQKLLTVYLPAGVLAF